ncbi:MAG: methyltransferase domain-containing protein [Candidatus Dormiibacterota bacterium]
MATFDQLVAEAAAAPIEGWDFSWLEGRASEERPSWGYARRLVPRVAGAQALLDVQTGGGEVLAGALAQAAGRPALIAASESWPPNLARARERLGAFGASVAEAPDRGPLPYPDHTFDLVVSRHPTVTVWPEIGRVLQPGGTYFSQQVGAGTNHELTDFMMGPQPIGDGRSTRRAVAEAEAAGLQVLDLREATLRAEFFDVGAVVYFLRKVLWTVPGFTVEAYHEPLRRMHEHIESQGPFVSSVGRFLVEARKLP